MHGGHSRNVAWLVLSVSITTWCGVPASSRTFKQEIINPGHGDGVFASTVVYVENGAADWCSAVAVGDHVLLTAAHCQSTDAIELDIAGDTVEGTCTCPPEVESGGCAAFNSATPRSQGPDLAICYFEQSFAQGVETISTDLALLETDQTLVLAGFGCISWDLCPSGTESYGKGSEEGFARILQEPAATDLYFYTVADPSKGESSLCSGDSGGPVFLGGATGDPRVVGVGRGGCADDDVYKSEITNLAATTTVRWLCSWQSTDPKRAINGLTGCP